MKLLSSWSNTLSIFQILEHMGFWGWHFMSKPWHCSKHKGKNNETVLATFTSLRKITLTGRTSQRKVYFSSWFQKFPFIMTGMAWRWRCEGEGMCGKGCLYHDRWENRDLNQNHSSAYNIQWDTLKNPFLPSEFYLPKFLQPPKTEIPVRR